MGYYNYWPPYVSVAKRRRRAEKKIAKMRKSGRDVAPVDIEGRNIATTFWGAAWCRNLEAYSDYANRLPRGRNYVRNGSVIDLQIEAGRVRSLVSGSRIYKVNIAIKPLSAERWAAVKAECAGRIGSLVELLRGSISREVMNVVTRKDAGLFPAPREISLSCSCPDCAIMCKHVAATLYGVGARLDREPGLLFTLRGVEPSEMAMDAVEQAPAAGKPMRGRLLKADDMSAVFGIDLDMGEEVLRQEAPHPAPHGQKRDGGGAGKSRRKKTARRGRKQSEANPRKGDITLTTPAGFRVEGFTVGTLVEILQEMRRQDLIPGRAHWKVEQHGGPLEILPHSAQKSV